MTDLDWVRLYGFATVADMDAAFADLPEPEPFRCPTGYNDAACDAFCEPGHPYHRAEVAA